MYSEEKRWGMALERLDEAIAYNGRNYTALNLKGSVLKSLGRDAEARQCFDRVLADDPINAYALHETASHDDFRRFMREQPESYLELAIQYWHNGFTDTAVNLLKEIDARVPYPTVKMYLGYLTGEDRYFGEALSLPVGYCAPFRLETVPVLEKAKSVCSDSSLPYYYLGNLYYNIQPDNAIREWEKCVGDTAGQRSRLAEPRLGPLAAYERLRQVGRLLSESHRVESRCGALPGGVRSGAGSPGDSRSGTL